MDEIWRDISGYEGYYQVSNLGNVRSCDRWLRNGANSGYVRHGSARKAVLDFDGYRVVGLNKEHKCKTYRIARLVAIAFIPNTYNKSEVNHIDGNKQNDCVSNLEWCTRSENVKHAFDTGLKTFSSDRARCTGRLGILKKMIPIVCLDTGEYFESTNKACRYLGHSDSSRLKRAMELQIPIGGHLFQHASLLSKTEGGSNDVDEEGSEQ